MRQLINILYRRILYKIPLKLLLVILALFAIFFASFSHAELLADFGRANGTSISSATQFGGSTKTTCFYTITAPESDGCGYSFDGTNYSSMGGDNLICVYGVFYMRCSRSHTFRIFSTENIVAPSSKCQSSYSLLTQNQCNSQYSGYILPSNCPSSDPMTSLQCQTEYSLIPVSEVDSSYCQSNNLCPSGGTIDCPNVGVSNLFINDLFHPGAFNIIMNIPEEIDWDYAYTNSGNNMNIDVVGYNVDYTKVQEVIDTQNYKPTQEDFQNLIALLGPYSKIIIFFVVLFLIWAWIKKPFKSKL